jgi:hypothetical protein
MEEASVYKGTLSIYPLPCSIAHSFPLRRVRPAQALHPNCLLHLLRHPLQGRSSPICQARSCQLEEDPNSPSSTQVQGRKGASRMIAMSSCLCSSLVHLCRGSTPPLPPLRTPRPLELKSRSLFNKRNGCDPGLEWVVVDVFWRKL